MPSKQRPGASSRRWSTTSTTASRGSRVRSPRRARTPFASSSSSCVRPATAPTTVPSSRPSPAASPKAKAAKGSPPFSKSAPPAGAKADALPAAGGVRLVFWAGAMAAAPASARRVVVTGAGVVTALGAGREAFWDALERGVAGTQPVELDRVGSIAACAVGPLDDVPVDKRELRRLDRAGLLAVVAAAQALEDAGAPELDPMRTGAVIANAHGGAETIHRAYTDFFERGVDRISPFTVPLGLTNSPVAAVARLNGLHGPSASVATACAAGTDAIGLALSLIRQGKAAAMLAGGAEAPLSPLVVAAYRQLGALS